MLKLIVQVTFALLSALPPVDVESLVRENDHSVVIITGLKENNGNTVQGSGCCVSANGYILATAHQVTGVVDLKARFINGDIVPLKVVEVLPELELSLLKADAPVAGVARIGDAMALSSGSPLIAIASPQGLEFSTITGIVSSTNRTFKDMPVIQTNLQVDSGASGGPVFDQYGQLVGIVMLNMIDAGWISAINPINNAYPVLEKYGVLNSKAETAYNDDYELVPVANVSEREYRAIEAYNKGVNANTPEEKREAFALAVKLLPEFFEAWFNLAVVHTQEREMDEAVAAYQKAQSLRGESLAVCRNLGRIYLVEKNLPDAAAVFTRALQLAPGDAQSYNDLGEVYRRMQNADKARGAFESALSINPDYASARYNLAITLAASGDKAAAVEAFERYLENAPNAKDAEAVREWIEKLRKSG